MCLPSCASFPLTAAVSVRTFLLHFKAPRRLMSYPGIMKGETLMGFEIGAERVSSSHLFLFPLSSPRVQGKSQHFHLDGSSTGLRIGRCSDWTRRFLSFSLYHLQINPWSCLFDPLKKQARKHLPVLPLCWDVLQMKSRGDYCCSSSSLTAVHHGFSHLLASCLLALMEQSIKALSHL